MTFTPSPRQSAIADQLAGPRSLLVQACAGSGKTTTVVWLASMVPAHLRVLALSFNKAIAEELGRRMPVHVRSATMHSVGFGIIRRSVKNVKLDDYKLHAIIDTHPGIAMQDVMLQRSIKTDLLNLVPIVQDTMADPYNLDMLAAAVESNGTMLEQPKLSLPLVASIVSASDHMRHVITYGEMIRHPALHDYTSDLHDVVFVDEAQDLNAAQHLLLKKLVRPGGKVIGVGDSKQSIYAFRGADPRSMSRLKDDWNMLELPLDISYRCSSRIVQEAQTIVGSDVIKAHEHAATGEVSHEDYHNVASLVQDDDMVLCRLNRPLVQLAFQLFKQGKRAVIKGKDIGSQLATLVRQSNAATVPKLLAFVLQWRKDRIDKAVAAKKPEVAIQGIEDRADTLIAIAEECQSMQDVQNRVNDLFSEHDNGILLSTVHKAKGLEADTVWILGPELLLGGRAKSLNEQEQERNIRYVAVTRAKTKLIMVPLPKKDN